MTTKKASIIILFVLGLIVVLATACIVYMRPNLDEESAVKEARALIASVGGADKVCKEAHQIFARFGVANIHFFSTSELKDYPTMSALGQVDGIWPGDPAYIKIRIGTHLNGYIIEIVDVNSIDKNAKSPNGREIGSSCIFVHR